MWNPDPRVALQSPTVCSLSTRAGVVGTSECTRSSTRLAASSHRLAPRSAASDHIDDAIRFSTVPRARTRRSRPGASASSNGPASRFGSMTSAAPTRPGGAFASAAHTGSTAEALLPEPVSPSTSAWRVSSARGTTPCGGYSARQCGTASPAGLSCALAAGASSVPTRSTRRNVSASCAEMAHSGSASRRYSVARTSRSPARTAPVTARPTRAASTPSRRGASPPQARGQRGEHPPVRTLRRVGHARRRTPTREHPLDQPTHHRLVDAAQRVVHLRARARGDRPRVVHPRRVVQQTRPTTGHPLVPERDHDRSGAEGVGDDTGAQPHPPRPPVPGTLDVVVERRHQPARRGDDQLDAGVEVALDQCVDEVDEAADRGPVDLAGERDNRAVVERLERQHGLASCDDVRVDRRRRGRAAGVRARARGKAASPGLRPADPLHDRAASGQPRGRFSPPPAPCRQPPLPRPRARGTRGGRRRGALCRTGRARAQRAVLARPADGTRAGTHVRADAGGPALHPRPGRGAGAGSNGGRDA